MDIVGISLLYLVYFNAPIYLVKGGRLSLMPGVLFHSCRPSFRHTGVMFLDFAFLTRLGVMGTQPCKEHKIREHNTDMTL